MSLISFSLGSAQWAEAVRSCSQRSARRRVQRPGLRAGPHNPELNLMGEIGVGMEVGGGFDVRLRRSEFVLPCSLRAANYGHVPMGIALKDSHSLLMASAPCARGHLEHSSCMKPAHGKTASPPPWWPSSLALCCAQGPIKHVGIHVPSVDTTPPTVHDSAQCKRDHQSQLRWTRHFEGPPPRRPRHHDWNGDHDVHEQHL